MMTLGTHILCELSGCEPKALNNLELIEAGMVDAAKIAGANVLHHYFHPFQPHGVSGVVVISESHFSIHTWPERGYAALDFYTCGTIDPRVACDHMGQLLVAKARQRFTVYRGIPTLDHCFEMRPAA